MQGARNAGWRWAGVLCAALLLIGCQSKRGAPTLAGEHVSVAEAMAPAAEAKAGADVNTRAGGKAASKDRKRSTGKDEGAHPASAQEQQPAAGAAQSARRTPEVPAPPPIDADPAQLLKMAPAALRARLGEPIQQRREAKGRVWQYRSKACVLDIFLYPDGAEASPRVTYLEARDRAGAPVATRGCLEKILRRRRAAETG